MPNDDVRKRFLTIHLHSRRSHRATTLRVTTVTRDLNELKPFCLISDEITEEEIEKYSNATKSIERKLKCRMNTCFVKGG